ncbi:pisatin demethylase (cytochrome P450) [Fusarium pseudoanthophilum]|uniref:Pisatin demethylase (Cytochrome P450) n=1 Tax=Fusarium pseudoanthophilum TaxID=48495 RepID=A0A8H5K387_9HYPO|nr:pisatin demethylase (cytochrome P450) [Fusarium pseudoanthophilum]
MGLIHLDGWTAALIGVFLFLWYVVSTIHQWARLRHFKGPTSADFSQLWLISRVGGGRTHLDLWEACKNYGNIACVGPNDLITSDPDLMKQILNVRTRYKRSSWYEAMRLDPTKDNVLSQRNDDLHASTRLKMAAAYSGKEVDTIETTSMPTIITTTVMPWMIKLLQLPNFRSMLPSDKDKAGVGRVMAIAKKAAGERFGPNPKVQRDMIGSFFARAMLQHEVESEVLMQILTGADTTATAIATLLYIISSPRVVHVIRTEIGTAKLSHPIVTGAEARAMPYLQAVIKEGLRIHPPVVSLMSNKVPQGGDTFKGQYLPEGTKIGYCAWGIFRRTDIWSEDSDEFRPERWPHSSVNSLRLMEGTFELVFGYRMLIRRFDLAVVDPIKPWQTINVGVFLQSEYWIKGYERESLV